MQETWKEIIRIYMSYNTLTQLEFQLCTYSIYLQQAKTHQQCVKRFWYAYCEQVDDMHFKPGIMYIAFLLNASLHTLQLTLINEAFCVLLIMYNR